MKRILKSAPSYIKAYICNNVLFLTFVMSSLINSFLLRAFTVKFSYNQIKPLLADIAAVLFIGLFAYCFKPKRRFVYYMIWTCVFALLSAGNSIYYTNYKSFISVSLISTASQLGGVIDAVTENIMEPKDLIFLWSIIAMIAEYVYIRKKKPDYFSKLQEKKLGKKYALGTLAVSVSVAGIFATTLTGTDVSRLAKQWNREYVLGTFGLYTYQISDTVSCIHAKLNMLLGFDESEQAFKDFYDEKEEVDKTSDDNAYSGIFKGKNVLTIHAESIQQFALDTYINGEELTPNLNKLAREGLYFSNFYAQESVGTSSDSEFTFSTSLMPASSGTVAINYWDRDYTSIQSMLGDMGYYTFSMHGNNGSYWNRMNLHSSLGYDKFYNYSTDFNIDETIGLGLSDKSFFNQAVPKIKEIAEQNDKYYGTLIMLTNHTPFTDIERVSDFEVDFKYKRYNEETGLYEEVSAPFLEGTKLGSYFKSVHYADEAIGQLMAELDEQGLLDNTVIVIYGDHDAKVKEEEYEYYYNYNPFTEETLTEDDEGYIPVDDFYYNLNRKVPFIIWSKDGGYEPKEITQVMGMYDVQPTLGNMLGFENKYALGHDIFSIDEDEENIVIFPNGNFLTDTIYYDSQKDKYFDITGYENVAKYASCNQTYKDTPNPIYSYEIHGLYKTAADENYSRTAAETRTNNGIVDENYISERSGYAEERINISNAIIYYDMINKTDEGFGGGINSTDIDKDKFSVFSPPSTDDRDRLFAA
ncbi:LTA synthase family protein [Ruminococcus sp. Marseille-P6503]|uniref:LTA synthase family protein n=1 Tax=Ruminococcus sp. Marseille-P6503 TaxID=2364796 RepID=UPI000F535DD7|nr:LTA synthase family protein [Ruminococcus sp. Marseille-P6503]